MPMCYSEKYYKNAKQFNPKRWLKGAQVEAIDPFTSLPFGFGARMCIGRRLAEQKMYLILSKVFFPLFPLIWSIMQYCFVFLAYQQL